MSINSGRINFNIIESKTPIKILQKYFIHLEREQLELEHNEPASGNWDEGKLNFIVMISSH